MLSAIAIILAALIVVLMLRDLARLHRLPSIPDSRPPSGAPQVSILVPARNEVRGIERCVRGALAQDYPSYELIVIDDGSSDGTELILRRLQVEERRLQVIEAGPLPQGWKGKQYALSRGYAAAQGSWILFLDADTAPQPQLLSTLVAYAERQRIDMLSVLPLLELGSFWERAVLPAFASLVQAIFPLEDINSPAGEIAMANGQCILISRAAYEAIGRHEAVRDTLAEDLALARLAKAAGLRLFLADGRRLIRVRMYYNGREVVEGLTKNAMSGVALGGLRTLRGAARQTLLALGPPLLAGCALWSHARRRQRRLRRILAAAAGITLPLALWSWGRMYRTIFAQPARYGLLYPLGIVAYGLIGLYAALRLRLGKGVSWKGRTYSK